MRLTPSHSASLRLEGMRSPGWKRPDFDASAWDPATVHSEADVRPKDGYDRITWHPSAKLIWAGDLKKDNAILLRLVIEGP